MRRISVVLAAAMLSGATVFTSPAGPQAAAATQPARPGTAPPRFDLTVESIMRGPDLVG